MTTVADLTPEQKADLYKQVGDAMYNPGFNYDGHIAGNTVNGVFTPPVHIPSPSGSPATPTDPAPVPAPAPGPAPSTGTATPEIPLPTPGTPEYEALLLETGRSDLVGFSYSAHLAAKQGKEVADFDRFLNASSGAELVQLLSSVDVNQLVVQASSEQIQSLVKKFSADPAFSAYLDNKIAESPQSMTVGGLQVSTGSLSSAEAEAVPLPAYGSVAYKALLLETGRSDLIGFNYAAHLAAKNATALPDFDRYYAADSGTELLALLAGTNVNELMAKASPQQVQQLIGKFASDPAFKTYLDESTRPELPAEGSAQYQALLQQTGRASLAGFDYDGYLKTMTEATQVISATGLSDLAADAASRAGTTGRDVIRHTGSDDGLLAGGDGNDQIFGGSGNDMLVGGNGADQMRGGAGDDVYYVDHAKDLVAETANGGEDTLAASLSFVLPKHVENLILQSGDTKGSGNALANRLVGGEGDNILDGGLGADTLSGGAGTDTFVLSGKPAAANADVITDFAGDRIALDKRVFKALKSGIAEGNFVIGTAAVDANDFLVYDSGTLYYDPDGGGARAAVAVAQLTGAPSLSAADFIAL